MRLKALDARFAESATQHLGAMNGYLDEYCERAAIGH
jgi:hypothetical protein